VGGGGLLIAEALDLISGLAQGSCGGRTGEPSADEKTFIDAFQKEYGAVPSVLAPTPTSR